MKKTCRKLLILLLVVSMTLALSGCGSFQTQMLRTAYKMSKLKSFHADVNVDMEIALDLSGQEVSADALVTGGVDVQTDPLIIQTDLKLSVLGVEKDLIYTIVQKGDTLVVHPGGSDSGEETIVIQSEEVKPQSILQLTKLAARWSEYFTEPMDDAVNGEPARRYDGVLPQALAEELMGWLNGESETSEESENGRFPLSIWVNDDDYIVRVRTDLAVFLRDLVGEQMETMLEQYGLGGMDISMELKSVDTDIVLSQFNAVAPIAVPEDNG